MKGYLRKVLPLLLTLLMVLGAVSVANATDSGASAGGDYTMPTQMKDSTQPGVSDEPEQDAQVKEPDSGANSTENAAALKGAGVSSASVTVQIPVTKKMSPNRYPRWLATDSFSFTMSSDDPSAPLPTVNPLVLGISDTQGDKLAGNFTLEFTEPGEYLYSITEGEHTVKGVKKDPDTYYVGVHVTEDGGQLNPEVIYYETNDPNTSVPYVNSEFFNRYFSPFYLTELCVDKSMSGRGWNEGESYTFRFEAVTPGSPMPSGMPSSGGTVTLTAGTDPDEILNEAVGTIIFEEAGTYIYKITEEDNNYLGVKKDDRTVYAKVTVREPSSYYDNYLYGELYCYSHYPGDPPDTTFPWDTTFANTYSEPDPAELEIKTKKTYNGPAHTFRYGLYTTESTQSGTEGIIYPNDMKPADAGPDQLIGELHELAVGDEIPRKTRIEFTKPGTYTFKLKEDVPVSSDAITYDTHEVTVTVEVTYDNKNICYTADVTYDNRGSSVGSDGEVTDKAAFTNTYSAEGKVKLEVAKNFKSDVYRWKGWTDETFTFTLTRKDGKKIRIKNGTSGTEEVDSLEVQINKDTDGHTAAFSEMIYNFDDIANAEGGKKTFEYNLHEDNGGTTSDGITYAADQTVKVTVTDNKNGTLSTSVVYEDPGLSEAVMENDYKATGTATAEIKATKSYLESDGVVKTEWGGRTFDLQLIPKEDAPVPADADETTHITTKTASQDNPTVSFGDITYTKPGVYTYGIKEKLPAGVDPSDPADDDILYDTSEHSVTVTVEDDGKGGLKDPEVKYFDNDTLPVFENRDLPQLHVNIHAKKVLTGADLQDGEFSFELYKSNESGELLEKVKDSTASSDGVISGSLSFKYSDIFGDTPPAAEDQKTLYYAAKETKYRGTDISVSSDGFTFDTGDKLYRFTVKHSEGKRDLELVGNIEYSTDDGQNWTVLSKTSEPVFSNVYNSEGEGTLMVHKDFESDVYGWKGWTDETFTFKLTRKDGGKIRIKGEGSTTEEVKSLEVQINNGTDGHTETFDNIIYNQADLYDSVSGTYLTEKDIEYTISETKPATSDGITYDSDKTVTVHIHDDGAGKIRVTYTDGTSTGSTPVPIEFRNIYEINDSKTAKFKVSKTLTGRGWIDADEFSFLLEAVTAGAPMPAQGGETVKATSGSKSAEFGQITYDTAGVWRYKITEKDAGSAAIIKDSTAKFVTVTVEDGGKGKLKDPVVVYDNDDSVTEADSRVTDSAAFTNRYRATGTAKTSLTKEFVSDVHGWKGWTDEKFTFELKAKDGSDIRVKDGDSTKVVKSIHGTATASQPVVNFADIVYTQADMIQGGADSAERSFTYTIHEVRPAGDPDNGIVYAEDRDITVTVRDDGSGNLLTTIDYGKESNGNATAKLVMTNKYVTMGKVHAEIKAKKTFLDSDGIEKTDWRITSDGTAKTFDLELVPNGDEPVPPDADETTRVTTKKARQNASVVNFGQIEYTKAGVYEYLIREKLPEGASRENPVKDGILYDPSEHSVKVVVRDDGQGGLKKPEVHYYQDDDDDTSNIPVFFNTQLADGSAYAEMMAGKTMSGESLRNGEFTFTLYESDKDGKTKASGKIENTGNDEDGNVYFTPIVYRYSEVYGDETDPEPKVFYYAVKEDKGDNKGIAYDESVMLYRVTVNGEAAERKLTSTVEYRDGSSWKSLSTDNRPVFNNRYDSKGEAQISLNKSLTSDEAVWKGWTDQKFSFELTSKDGEKIRTEKDGEYVFVDKLTGTASKDSPEIALKIVYTRDDLIDKSAADDAESYLDSRTFEYTVREIVPEGAKNNKYKGVTYDSAERTVTVTISDNGDGTIKTVYGKDSATETAPVLSIVNTYSIDDSETAVIEVSKTLKGRDWKEGDKFSFTLEAMTDGAPMPWIIGRTASVKKNKTQDEFGKITYKEAGTWKYAVREKDSSIKGITTDSTVKYVTVTVADNGDGTLKTPVVTYDNSYSVSADDAAVKDKAAFTNTYDGKGTNTGDSTSIVIELVTAVCAAALLTVMLIRKRREKSSKQ